MQVCKERVLVELQHHARMAHRVCASRWVLNDVHREMKEVEPLAKESLAAFVLMKLKGRWAMPTQCEMVLMQGFALKLHDIGFGVVLHKASAAGIRATIFNSAKSQFLHAVKTSRKAGRTTVAVPFQPTGGANPRTHLRRRPPSHTPLTLSDLGALLTNFPDEEDGEDSYVMGYTLVPPCMMNKFIHYPS